MNRALSNILLEMCISMITSVTLIAWYDTFCERKEERKNFIISIILYVYLDVVLVSCVNYILKGGIRQGEIIGIAVTATQFVLEIILEWRIFVKKYDGGFGKKALLYVPYIIVIPAIEIFIQSILNKDLIVARISSYYIKAINNVTLLIAMYLMILIAGGFYRFIKYKRRNPQFIFFAIILAGQLILHYFFEGAFLATVNENKMSRYLEGYVFSAIILLCVAAIYQSHLKGLEYKRLENERQRTWEQRADYYQATSMATNELRKIEHDFKKRLLIIGHLAQTNQMKELNNYLESVLANVSPSTKIVEAGNAVISAIVTLMVVRCRENDIDFKYKLEYKELRVDDFDLSTIIGNILENAFEASIKEDNVSRRNISLSIQEKKGIILIRCKNHYIEKKEENKKDINSGKSIKDNHGLGLINVKDAAKKYNGEVSVETTNQIFEINIVLQ